MISRVINGIRSFIKKSFNEIDSKPGSFMISQERLLAIYENPKLARLDEIKAITELLLQLLTALIVTNVEKPVKKDTMVH